MTNPILGVAVRHLDVPEFPEPEPGPIDPDREDPIPGLEDPPTAAEPAPWPSPRVVTVNTGGRT